MSRRGRYPGGQANVANETLRPGAGKRAQLLDETRKYMIEGPDLARWVSGIEGFRVSEIVYKRGTFEITVTTATVKRVVIESAPEVEPASRRSVARPSVPVREVTVEGGPGILDEGDPGVIGKADAVPAIGDGRKRLRTRREMVLEAQKTGESVPPSRITHRSEQDDDPVPSAIPR